MSRAVYFWRTGEIPYGVFSNWMPSPFRPPVGMPGAGLEFKTAEHYIMWRKADLFGDEGTKQRILTCCTPVEAKQYGRRVQGFDDVIWDRHLDDIAEDALRLKFKAHPHMLEVLLATGDAPIAEASPVDRIWGIGIDAETARTGAEWKGENRLGWALMKVRTEFQEEQNNEA